jgi:hypothetical protein
VLAAVATDADAAAPAAFASAGEATKPTDATVKASAISFFICFPLRK